MRLDKKTHYKNSIYAGIHTISGTSQQEQQINNPEVLNAVKACSQRKKRNTDTKETYFQVNPNKYIDEKKLIGTYSEFLCATDEIMQGIGLSDYKITRADMCFNSDNKEDYLLFKKMHKLLICCMADTYSFKNCYQTFDLWQYNSLNVAIKNDEYELENYDKNAESQGRDTVKNRLELRSKRIKDNDLSQEFAEHWIEKLKKAINNYDSVQKRYNDSLELLYKKDLELPKEKRQYYNLTAFLMQFSDCIFSSKQMVDLLSRFDEVKNPVNTAKNFKRNHKIEYFSMADLQFVVSVIEQKAQDFFSC